MMEVLQWCINVGFLGYLVWTWWGKEEKTTVIAQGETQVHIQQLEQRIIDWESEFKKTRVLFDEKLKSIDAICEQASRILKSGRSTQSNFPPSQEEFDLKEALNQSYTPNEIPTLSFLEHTKKRLQKETELDLKTLLKGQLA